MANLEVGRYGELRASRYLERKGYDILDKNFRNSFGEIDIVAQSERYIVFVEVKTRCDFSYGQPIESVGIQKVKKIRGVAEFYMAKKKAYQYQPRFDIIEVVLDEERVFIRHTENAF